MKEVNYPNTGFSYNIMGFAVACVIVGSLFIMFLS